jgi:hypothetical protein
MKSNLPTTKRPWFNDRIKHSSRHKLNISKLLALFATLVVTKTIGHHSRPIETGSIQQPLHSLRAIDAYHKCLHGLLP